VRCSRGAEPEHENGSRFGSQASLSSQRTRFLGVASSAVLTAEALAQAIATPTTPTTLPADSPKSGTERRQDSEVAERNAVRNDAQDAQSGVRSGARDETNDGTLATAPPPPPSKKSNCRSGQQRHRPASARPQYRDRIKFCQRWTDGYLGFGRPKPRRLQQRGSSYELDRHSVADNSSAPSRKRKAEGQSVRELSRSYNVSPTNPVR
jgi:hypothetical protein